MNLSADGISYTFGRVPISSTDFSLSIYSYDETVDDMNLTNFKLNTADTKYKIPYIKMAMEIAGGEGAIKFFASPWSAPGWMKTNGRQIGRGTLRGPIGREYHQTWADYFVK